MIACMKHAVPSGMGNGHDKRDPAHPKRKPPMPANDASRAMTLPVELCVSRI